MGAVLGILVAALIIILVVRLGKATSRAVDREQVAKQRTKEIKLGMAAADVESILGSPSTKVDLAEKVLYRYEDMTVEFHGGKVTDVR